MINSDQITEKLKRIEQYQFGYLVDNLVHQGAFPELANTNSSVESYGVNVDKHRTIKSAPYSDSEIKSLNISIESSVREDWDTKLKEEVEKNKERGLNKFAFFTNQDTGTKQISDNGTTQPADDFIKSKIKCPEAYVFGQKDIVLRLQNPQFFNLRRNFLQIEEDIFYTAEQFQKLLNETTNLNCDTPVSEMEVFGQQVETELKFNPNNIIILHNDDYLTLLHTVGIWAKGRFSAVNKEGKIIEDFCFIDWPRKNRNFTNADRSEINGNVNSFVFIWGADEIDNISDYLAFDKDNAMLVLVCHTGFKEDVIGKLHTLGGQDRISEITIPSIDQRVVPEAELRQHESKVRSVVQNTTNLLLQYESLIYFYSPYDTSQKDVVEKIEKLLNITPAGEQNLRVMLISNDFAAVTGNILWLKHPGAGKQLLSQFITDGVFKSELLV